MSGIFPYEWILSDHSAGMEELNSEGRSKMSDIYCEDPENRDEDDLLDHMDKLEDAYGASCGKVADACGVEP